MNNDGVLSRVCPSWPLMNLNGYDDVLVAFQVQEMRAICAREFGLPTDHPFFSADYRQGEESDAALIRLFAAERARRARLGDDVDDEAIIMILIHG